MNAVVGTNVYPGTVPTPRWRKYTVAATAFTAAATSEDIELFSLAAGDVIHGVKTKHSVAFSGGSSSAVTLSVGIAGDLAKYSTAFDVFQAVANDTFQISEVIASENHASSTSVRVAAVSVGDNLVNVSTGSVDIWVLVSRAV
jgi:hypothetical protein